MREAFFRSLNDASCRRSNIYLLSGDLGYKLFDEFRATYPKRFVNIGVAESNMVGVAAGLALCGKNVYCYSIIPFLAMRAFDQIRVDIASQNLNVKLIGVGEGFTYGLEGFTHFGIEDISLMRSLPNMDIVVPADAKEAEWLATISCEHPSPLYIRLGNNGAPALHAHMPRFEIGKGMIVSEGKDAVIFATGSMVYQAKLAVDILNGGGFTTTLVNMHTIKPLDTGLIRECARSHEAVFTVEEHSITGGLGSAVAETLAEDSFIGIFKRLGIPERLEQRIGNAGHLRDAYGLTAGGIAECVIGELQRGTVWVGG